jgi:hypothetical protein
MIEVMVAIAILATVFSVLAGNIYTLSTARTAAKESAIVQEILRGMAERVQGANFSTLGQNNPNVSNLGAWSWHRRLTARPPSAAVGNPPMTDEIPTVTPPATATATNVLPFVNCLVAIRDGTGQLISPGLLQERSGVRDLRVFLEYYREAVLVDELATAAQPQQTWRNICTSAGPYAGQNSLIFADDNTMDAAESDAAAVLIRVVVTWTSQAGGTQTRELTIARRQ